MIHTILMWCGALTEIAAAIALIVFVFNWGKKIIEGQRCQLRTDILHTYYKNKDTKKIRQYEAENLVKNYEAYKALKGNSFIDDIYSDTRKWEVIS